MKTLFLIMLGISLAMNAFATAADVRERFEARTFSDAAGEKLNYRLLKPLDYNKETKYPLVVFLHGAGERGSDNFKQLVHGMADFASDEAMKKHPAFVIAPQCPDGKQWVNVSWSADSHKMPEKAAEPLQQTIDLVDSLAKEFSIDPNRIYITGLSMGGYGTWDAAQRWPDKFAAAAPVCGGGDAESVKQIKSLPIWAFHGGADGVVRPKRSRDMIEALKKAGGSPKYTEYKDVGHDSWSATYRNPEFHDWLFAQKRTQK